MRTRRWRHSPPARRPGPPPRPCRSVCRCGAAIALDGRRWSSSAVEAADGRPAAKPPWGQATAANLIDLALRPLFARDVPHLPGRNLHRRSWPDGADGPGDRHMHGRGHPVSGGGGPRQQMGTAADAWSPYHLARVGVRSGLPCRGDARPAVGVSRTTQRRAVVTPARRHVCTRSIRGRIGGGLWLHPHLASAAAALRARPQQTVTAAAALHARRVTFGFPVGGVTQGMILAVRANAAGIKV